MIDFIRTPDETFADLGFDYEPRNHEWRDVRNEAEPGRGIEDGQSGYARLHAL